MKVPHPTLTYANVMATVAVFTALGGSAYAATHLTKNSVGTKQIKNHSITLSKLSVRAAAALKGATGPQGMPGAPGAPGAPGSAKAWAKVSSSGKVLDSSGDIAATRLSTGRYCISAGPYTTANSVAVAISDFSDPKTEPEYRVQLDNGTRNNECPAGQFEVTGLRGTNILEDLGFTFIVG